VEEWHDHQAQEEFSGVVAEVKQKLGITDKLASKAS
jgi:hypothetical protein